MNSTGTLLRIFGAAILLIAVQFASVAAEAHVGHSHGHDGHGARAHGAAVGIANLISAVEAGSAHPVAQAQRDTQVQPGAQDLPAAQAEAAVRNAGGVSPSGSNACVMGCCGGTGCCGAALVTASPDLPPRACSPRIGLTRVISIRGADPRGLRKPPRSFA